MKYIVIAEGAVKRACRLEARSLGTVEADSREEALRLARESRDSESGASVRELR
jgi:hypothetical protein